MRKVNNNKIREKLRIHASYLCTVYVFHFAHVPVTLHSVNSLTIRHLMSRKSEKLECHTDIFSSSLVRDIEQNSSSCGVVCDLVVSLRSTQLLWHRVVMNPSLIPHYKQPHAKNIRFYFNIHFYQNASE